LPSSTLIDPALDTPTYVGLSIKSTCGWERGGGTQGEALGGRTTT
jgi:hypothetical protein